MSQSLIFAKTRTAYASYSKSAPSVHWTPFSTVTVEYVWVTVQTKVNRCISPRKGKKSEVERKAKSELGKERKDWEMKVATWHRECDSVMQTGFIVSPQCPGEIISSQYGVYQSLQNTTFPLQIHVPSVCISQCLSVCLYVPQRCTFRILTFPLVTNIVFNILFEGIPEWFKVQLSSPFESWTLTHQTANHLACWYSLCM